MKVSKKVDFCHIHVYFNLFYKIVILRVRYKKNSSKRGHEIEIHNKLHSTNLIVY